MNAEGSVEPIVQVEDLVKQYKTLTAVDGISFDVQPGECFGILGPNGAGKSSTIRILTAISPATSGRVVVDGMDVARQPRQVKAILGVVPQDENLDTDLPVLQNLLVYSRYFRMQRDVALANAQEALEFFRKSSTLRQDAANVHYAEGLAHLQLEDLAAAEGAFVAAVQLDEDHVPALHNLAHVLDLTGRLEDAAEYYLRVARLTPHLGTIEAVRNATYDEKILLE